MPLIGKACERTPEVIDTIADTLGCEAAVIDAIIAVETVGDAFDFKGRLIIRPEVHKVAVCPYLSDEQRKQAAKLGFTKKIRWREYGDGANVAAGDQRWDWIDQFRGNFGDEAAYWVTSFGSPQIMGFNFRHCGYAMPSQMVAAFAESEDAQLMAMGMFLKSAGLVPALRQRQWKQIARLYNGKDYAKNRYDVKLAQAYERSSCRKGSVLFDPHDAEMLQYGDQGQSTKSLQEKLRSLGFYVDADGDFGVETKDAVMAFQRRAAVTVDGKVGPVTRQALDEAAPKDQNQKPVSAIVAESKTAQAGIGTIAVGAAGAVASIGQALTAAPDVPVQAVSFDNVNQVLLHTERGIGLTQKVFSIGVDKILIALAITGIICGGLALYSRIKAQRLRKIG